MKKLIFLSFIFIPIINIVGQIIYIPNDYSTIQEGIDAAIEGDTVLVDTGIYVENIDFTGKNITVASNYLMTSDTSYISQTIIDGNQDGCVVVFNKLETSQAKLIGFTIMNGYNDLSWPYGCGGGILTYDANPTLIHLRLINNYSIQGGGGIACLGGGPYISSTTISNNLSSSIGGGIYTNGAQAHLESLIVKYNEAENGVGAGAYLSYADLELDNIVISHNKGEGLRFFNSSSYLKEVKIKHNSSGLVCGGDYPDPIPIFDTIYKCSIYNNSSFQSKDIISSFRIHIVLDTFSVLYPTDYYVLDIDSLSFDIEKGFIDQIDTNVYVSANGSDSNDGLSEDSPFKTIQYAISKLRADSLNHHKILLMDGVYGPSSNGENLPVNLPAFIDITGYGTTSVILDAEGQSNVLIIDYNSSINQLSNFTIKGGASAYYGGGIFINLSKVKLENLDIVENDAIEMGGGICIWSSMAIINNLKVMNNYADISGGGIWCYNSTVTAKNLLIVNNEANVQGGGLSISRSNVEIINSTISNNLANTSTGNGGGIYMGGFSSHNNHLWLTNSIVWENTPNQIAMEGPQPWHPVNADKLYCLYSDIEDGELGILIQENDTVFWFEGNIELNPTFLGTGNNPYQISSYSPCVDAGTQDTSGLNLPDYDLAGVVRIFNDRIDIGAYEWNTFVEIHEYSQGTKGVRFNLYPNPTHSTITIELPTQASKNTILTLSNTNGQQLITQPIAEPQTEIDISHLPVGIYIVKVWNDKDVMVQKVMKQ